MCALGSDPALITHIHKSAFAFIIICTEANSGIFINFISSFNKILVNSKLNFQYHHYFSSTVSVG